jgi:acetoin utilization protein AcuB
MFVSQSMTKKVITIEKDTNIFEAKAEMAEHRIRHLPVVDKDNRLIGIVTDRDIRSALPSIVSEDFESKKERERLSGLKVKDIMSTNLITIPLSYTLQDALLMIEKTRVGAFPVVDENGFLKGIISIRDLMRAFISVLGIGEPGALLGILVENEIGQLKKIVDAITEENISFGSVLVIRYWEEGKRAVFPYLLTQNIGPVKRKLVEMGYTLLDPMKWALDQLPKNE